MGAACSGTDVRQVLSMANRAPQAPEWTKLNLPPNRFSPPIVTRLIGNRCSFDMGVRTGESINRAIVELPVLSDLVECLIHPTYELKLLNQTIVDIFDLQDTQQILIQAMHKKTGVQYSMKVYGCTSYMDESFMRGLYEAYLHGVIGHQDRGVMDLVDAFVVDRSQFRKALILLFQPVQTTLSNVMEYRKLASVPWTYSQQQAIAKNILSGMFALHSNAIVHRDIRPSTIFYSGIKGEYLLGNLSSSQIVPTGIGLKEMYLSVCGVMVFNSEKVNQIIRSGDRAGFYSPVLNDCICAARVLSCVARLEFINFLHVVAEPVDPVIRLLEEGQQGLAYSYISNASNKVDEGPIVRWVQLLLTQANLHLNQKAMLNGSFYLMYSEDFSKLAHQEIEKNILNEVPFQNAYLYMRLAEFYVNTGADPQEYFISAFSLYLRRAEKNRKRGHYALAVVDLTEAKRAEGFVTPAISVAYKTELAVLKSDTGQIEQANFIMAEAMRDAANLPLAPEAQLLLLLSKGYICIRALMFAEGMRFLQYGLQLCQSSTNFKTRFNQRRMKSFFHLNLGRCLLSQVRGQGEPMVRKEILAEAESHLLSALEIRQSDRMDEIEVSEAFDAVADLYLERKDYYLASKALTKSLALKDRELRQFSPLFLVPLEYELGNCHYHLKDNSSAEIYYKRALENALKFPNEGVQIGKCYYQLGMTLLSEGNQQEGAIMVNLAKQTLSGLLSTNDSTVMALDQQITGMLATTGIVPPDVISSATGMRSFANIPGVASGLGGLMNTGRMIGNPMVMSGGMGMPGTFGAPGIGMPGMMGSGVSPMMGGPMMGGPMMGGSMSGSLVSPMLGGMGGFGGGMMPPQPIMGGSMMRGSIMAGSMMPPQMMGGVGGGGLGGMLAGSLIGGMGGSLLRNNMGGPPGAAMLPQQMMNSNSMTPMSMTSSMTGPFGGNAMGLSVR